MQSFTPIYSYRLTALVPPLQRTKATFRSPVGAAAPMMAAMAAWFSGPAGGAGVHRSLTRQDGGGAAGAAGIAAAAAVGAGQMAEDLLSRGSFFTSKILEAHGQDEAECGAENAQHHNGSNDITDIHISSCLLLPDLQAGEAMNARAIRPAVTRAMGKPSNALG